MFLLIEQIFFLLFFLWFNELSWVNEAACLPYSLNYSYSPTRVAPGRTKNISHWTGLVVVERSWANGRCWVTNCVRFRGWGHCPPLWGSTAHSWGHGASVCMGQSLCRETYWRWVRASWLTTGLLLAEHREASAVQHRAPWKLCRIRKFWHSIAHGSQGLLLGMACCRISDTQCLGLDWTGDSVTDWTGPRRPSCSLPSKGPNCLHLTELPLLLDRE